MAEELAKAKRSLSAFKGQFTQRYKVFETGLVTYKKSPEVEENWTNLDNAFQKVKQSYDKLEDAFTDVEILDPEADLEGQARVTIKNMEDVTKEYSKAAEIRAKQKLLDTEDRGQMRRQLDELRRQMEAQSIGGAGGTEAAAPRVVARSVDSLKPDQLTKSMKPEEFRVWRRKFMDWFGPSNFHTLSVDNQIVFLRSVMEAELINQVDFEGATTIQVALDRVEAVFMMAHPLLNRRVAFFNMKQAEGQPMSEHIIALKLAALEADVDSMSAEDHKASRIISSCTEGELLTKLLDMKPAVDNKPTVVELEKVVADFEARKISEGLLIGGGAKSRRVKNDKDKCWKCQQKGHFARECTFPKDKLQCKICNTKGLHNTFEGCQGKEKKERYPKGEKEKKKKKKKAKNRRSQTPGPGGDGSATETDNEESSTEQEDHNRRVVARRIVAKSARRVMARRLVARNANNQPVQEIRRVTAKCRQQGVPSYPTPSIEVGVRTSRAQKTSVKVYAIPDTGCTATVLSSREAARCKLKVDKNVDINLSDAAGKRMKTHGLTTMFINSIDGTLKKIEAIVSPDLSDPCLVSWKDLIELQYLPENWPCIKPRVRKTEATHKKAQQLEEVDGELPEEEESEDDGEKPWPPEEWGKEITDVIKEYLHLFKNKLGVESRIKAPPMDIVFKEDAVLPQTTHIRQIPVHLRAMADECVEDALKGGIIEKTIDGEACAPAHFVEKYDAEGNITGVRLVCDLKRLNNSVKRSAVCFPTGNDIWNQVDQGSKRFFKMDLTSGYHQVELSQEARKYFNFILPQGRFRYTSAPMGFVSSGDWFNQLTDRVLKGIPGTQKEVDDILGQAVDNASLAVQLREILKRCHENNITLSKKKMEVGDDVHFAGFRVGVAGCRPDPSKIVALKNFKTPTNPTEVRSFLGAVNQMSCWWPDLSQHCVNLRKLTEHGTAWNWLSEHEEEFQKIKDVLSDSANLAPYDPKRKTELLTDASRLGLGFVLIQFDEVSKRWRLIRAGSTALKKAQKRYPPIQLELLGLAWALQSCRYYLRAHPGFMVKTDHNPLVGLLKRDIRDTSDKLQPLLEACSMYNFKIEYIPGKKNKVADLLSRNPLWGNGPTILDQCGRVIAEDETLKRIREDPRISEILKAASASLSYKEAVKAKLDGLNADEVKKLPHEHGARGLQKWWNTIGVLDDKEDTIMVMDGHRIVVPLGARKAILSLLHVPHMATAKTRKAAAKRYFWVGMADEVKKMCEQCQTCRERGPSRPEEPLGMPIPKAAMDPMEMIGLDIGQFSGTKYLICVDRYSGYPLVGKLGKTSSTKEVIKMIQGWFRTFGYAKRARHDDGPEFRDKFVAWLTQVGCKSEVSSAYNPTSNGLAEAGVKNVKSLLKKCFDSKECFETALAEFRIAPREDGYSPAELFYKRHVRGLLPELPRKLNVEEAERARDKVQEKAAAQRQTRSTSKILGMGQKVWLQDQQTKRWTIGGVIKSIRNGGRSYVVETDNGAAYLRNRRFIKASSSQVKQVALRVQHHKDGDTTKKKKKVSFKLEVSFQ